MARSSVTVDLGAIRHNARTLVRVLQGAELWAVVKADGYGHGAADVGRAALEAGARALCVAGVAEGEALREALREAPRPATVGLEVDRCPVFGRVSSDHPKRHRAAPCWRS